MAVPLLIIFWFFIQNYKKSYYDFVTNNLKVEAFLIASKISEYNLDESSNKIDSICKELSKKIATRITVISSNGDVIGDSEKDPDSMENHKNRSEVIAALRGEIGVLERYSHTLNEDMLYMAVPFIKNDKIVAVIRTSLPITVIKKTLNRMYHGIGLIVLCVAFLGALGSYLMSKKSSRPVMDIKIAAERFSNGDFSYKIPKTQIQEADEIAQSLNNMAENLKEKINLLYEEKSKIDAILSSMNEGVIAIDENGKILIINSAAYELFNIEINSANGKWIGEVIRYSEVQEFFENIIEAKRTLEKEITIYDLKKSGLKVYLRLNGTCLFDKNGKCIGGLIVASNITKLKELDEQRKEFLANVSHEMRTPLTSIKGYLETIREGNVNSPEDTKKFLDIIYSQVERLTLIVDDLLSLSLLEKDKENGEIQKVKTNLYDILKNAVEVCLPLAHQKQQKIMLNCDNTILGYFEPNLLEQAIINLLDNAIKYSEPNKNIFVEGKLDEEKKEIIISVKDEGPGIEKKHLDRLFERFYRVDKSRSRKLGGTGLGLAIVKHIAIAHKGRVSVCSSLGEGSTFFIYIPVV
jgi:two-component system phosphate regulon sensor histidine kinase PhoR